MRRQNYYAISLRSEAAVRAAVKERGTLTKAFRSRFTRWIESAGFQLPFFLFSSHSLSLSLPKFPRFSRMTAHTTVLILLMSSSSKIKYLAFIQGTHREVGKCKSAPSPDLPLVVAKSFRTRANATRAIHTNKTVTRVCIRVLRNRTYTYIYVLCLHVLSRVYMYIYVYTRRSYDSDGSDSIPRA